jgi:TrmH family RNA methyltransferase
MTHVFPAACAVAAKASGIQQAALIARCTHTIPQPSGEESLNVAAAAAICFYEAARQGI